MTRKTLAHFFAEEVRAHPAVPGALAGIVSQLALASKVIARETARIALHNRTGSAGEANITGDEQKKMDVYSNDIVLKALRGAPGVAAFVSEEMDEIQVLSDAAEAQFIVCADPFDGSSNTDINGSVGTIFGIYGTKSAGPLDPSQDILRKGSEQVAAGYVMYGTSTLLVLTLGHGVHGFTLDGDVGEFVLTHPDIRCPAKGKYYSANVGNHRAWDGSTRQFVDYITEKDPATKRPYSLRYSGALVGDLHRILLEGGIYFYPADAKNKSGKLRLLYECAPLAMVAEQAGGKATTGDQRILDLRAESAHQRVPLVIGSAEDVALFGKFSQNGKAQ
ncbi:MAG: class 1 fructose-bisphosphatase [Nitrospirae bacterium]|nr:class 1 fructose-bisphosphatase [Nitrospirota bacterium]